MTIEFVGFPKLARLSREVVITEKLDGTNAAVVITPIPFNGVGQVDESNLSAECARVGPWRLFAQSRTRVIVPGDDNFGFAAWVRDNAADLVTMGEGHHFGEWWGRGIQRGYGLAERRFSLFNVHRWGHPDVRPACCHVVPELWRGEFDTAFVNGAITMLKAKGSVAAPGFMKPEGVVIFHTTANLCFKKTIEKDEMSKQQAERERATA
jgi:hypothetical protein